MHKFTGMGRETCLQIDIGTKALNEHWVLYFSTVDWIR